MKRLASLLGLQAVFFPDMGSGATCPTVLTPTGYGKPVVGGGWTAQLVVTGLTRPRSLQFDSAGNLLVLEASKGVSRITFDDHGGTCLVRKDYATVLSLSEVCFSPLSASRR